MTNQMLLDRDIFEYWAHAAAFLPIADFRFSLPYKHALKSGQTHWYRTRDKKLMGELLARIRSDGPLRSRDVETDTTKRGGWWDWKPAKKALEQMYMEGDLMVTDREGFQKTYDLTERVLPSHVNAQMPSMDEFAAHIVETGALERPLPRLKSRMLILSPFDNSVIQRERLKALFQYDYQLECYVPAAKRQYGYFCLPLLYRDEFIGRMDCKAHRKVSHLEIKSLHFEQHNFDEELIITAFVDAITQFCHFQECNSVSLTKAHPKHLTQHLRNALKPLGTSL